MTGPVQSPAGPWVLPVARAAAVSAPGARPDRPGAGQAWGGQPSLWVRGETAASESPQWHTARCLSQPGKRQGAFTAERVVSALQRATSVV